MHKDSYHTQLIPHNLFCYSCLMCLKLKHQFNLPIVIIFKHIWILQGLFSNQKRFLPIYVRAIVRLSYICYVKRRALPSIKFYCSGLCELMPSKYSQRERKFDKNKSSIENKSPSISLNEKIIKDQQENHSGRLTFCVILLLSVTINLKKKVLIYTESLTYYISEEYDNGGIESPHFNSETHPTVLFLLVLIRFEINDERR